jgi:hypothetical protein
MSTPLVFQHGAASVAFSVELFGWLVFEAVMRVRQRLRSQGAPTWDPSAVVLVPCLAGSIIAAQLLGRRGGLPWPGGLLWPAVLPRRRAGGPHPGRGAPADAGAGGGVPAVRGPPQAPGTRTVLTAHVRARPGVCRP